MALNEPDFAAGFVQVESLRGEIERWVAAGLSASQVGVIIVDEDTYKMPVRAAGAVVRDDKIAGAIHLKSCHRRQRLLAQWAVEQGYKLAYGKQSVLGKDKVQDDSDRRSACLDFFPAGRVVYTKTPGDTNAFTNDQLRDDFQDVKLLVVVGFHVNACCAATARAGAMMGMTIMTSKDMVRTETGAEAPVCNGFKRSGNAATNFNGAQHPQGHFASDAAQGWPDGTIIAETY